MLPIVPATLLATFRPPAPPRHPGRTRMRLIEALAEQAEDEELELAADLLRRAALALAGQDRAKLFRLTYVSHNERGERDTPATAAAILAIARRRNTTAGVTGAMAYSPGWFAQVLEGGLAGVEHTFARILRDQRHSGICVLRMEEMRAREFAACPMAEAGPAPDALLQHAAHLHARMQGNAAPALERATRDILDVLHTCPAGR